MRCVYRDFPRQERCARATLAVYAFNVKDYKSHFTKCYSAFLSNNFQDYARSFDLVYRRVASFPFTTWLDKESNICVPGSMRDRCENDRSVF